VACAKPGKKDYTLMKAYRLLALLCAASKILEGMITSRVSWRAERGSWFHEHAYGFRPDRNKDGAVEELVTRAERAIHRGRVLVAVFFDVDGAFNQSWHPAVLTALQEKGCPPGLFCLISSFLRERQCNLNVNGFSASKLLRLGFPQGGVGPPIYWTTHNNRVAVYVEVGGEALFIGYADDNGFTVEGGPDELGALVELAARVLVSVIKQCRPLKINFSKDPEKMKAMAFTTCREGHRGKDIVVPAIVLDCQDMPEWHGHSIPVADELTFLGVILDRKLTWASHIEACTKKAKQLAVAMTGYARAKWGPAGIQQGAVEVRRLLHGLQRRLTALAMTGCFQTTSTSAALALAGLLPAEEMAAGKKKEGDDDGSTAASSTAMPLCPGDWRPSASCANGLHTCGKFGSGYCRPGSGWTGALSGAWWCRKSRRDRLLPAPSSDGGPHSAGHQGQLGGGRSTEARGPDLHGWIQAGGGGRAYNNSSFWTAMGGCWRQAFFGCCHGLLQSSHHQPGGGGCPAGGLGGVVLGPSAGGRLDCCFGLDARCAVQCAEPAQAHPITVEWIIITHRHIIQ